jgi:hypothetical protein
MRKIEFGLRRWAWVVVLGTLSCGKLRSMAVSEALGDAGFGVASGDVTGGTVNQTVYCGGKQKASYTHATFDVASGSALIAGGHCEVTLTDCTIKAPEGITAGGDAVVIMTGGSLHGSPIALKAGANAHVTVSGTTIDGKVDRMGSAIVTGVSGVKNPDPVAEKLGKDACTGYDSCYEAGKHVGPLSGKVIVAIGANGAATGARFEGNAPKDVVSCLVDLGKKKTVPAAGKAGTLTCQYSGSVTLASTTFESQGAFTTP